MGGQYLIFKCQIDLQSRKEAKLMHIALKNMQEIARYYFWSVLYKLFFRVESISGGSGLSSSRLFYPACDFIKDINYP